MTGISAVATASDFFTAIRTGRIPGHSFLTVSAVNRTVGGSFETIWDEGGIYAFPPGPTPMTLSSDDAADASPAGSGAHTVLVSYLDAAYTLQTEIVTLLGMAGVPLIATPDRIVGLQVLTWGVDNFNNGNIYIGTGAVAGGKPATVYGLIAPEDNGSLHGFFTIPADMTGYLCSVLGSVSGNKGVDTRIVIRPFGVGGFTNTGEIEQTGSADQFTVKGAIGYPARADLRFDSFVDVGTEEVTVFSEILLVSNLI